MKRYGSYAVFTPETTREEMEDALKRIAVCRLMDMGILKIKIEVDPMPMVGDDGNVEFYTSGGWMLDIPENECGGCQFWDGAACLNPASKCYGRETDDGCDKWDGGQDDDRA